MLHRIEEKTATQIRKSASQADLDTVAKTRLEITQFELFAKEVATIDNLEKVRDEMWQMSKYVKGLVMVEDMVAHTRSTSNALEDVSKELLLKCNIKDMCTLLDMKSNTEDVNRVFLEVNKELDTKISEEIVVAQLDEQKMVNEILCAENCVGRWLWKSGELGVGSAVPWEVQATNTCPDNFMWEKSRTSLVTVAPGLYEITLAFFSAKKPTV
jgi:hypothetical protein